MDRTMTVAYIVCVVGALVQYIFGIETDWDNRVIIALLGIMLFRTAIAYEWIDSMNFSGSKFTFDHAYLIILYPLPWIGIQWLAIIAFVDDALQHTERKYGNPNYTSPLHNLGYVLRLYEFRSWLVKKTGWEWLGKL
jgi:hypothetical protein